MSQELIGVISDIIFRNEDNGFTVLELIEEEEEKTITAVGSLPFAIEGERVKISGSWMTHPDYGEQIRIENYESFAPTNRESLERYLASGLIKGIGLSTARTLVEHFGLDILDIIQYSPDRLMEVPGIGEKRAATIASSFSEQKEVREVMLFLQSYGLSTNHSVKIYRHYGVSTITILKENPYRMAQDISGIGFKTADKVARHMGIEFDSPYRIMEGTKFALSMAGGQGHTYLPKDELIKRSSSLLGVEETLIENSLISLTIDQHIVVEEKDGSEIIYLMPFFIAETNIAKNLYSLSKNEKELKLDNLDSLIDDIEEEEEISLHDMQRQALIESLKNGVLIITGGPGTGKTTTVNLIIKTFEILGLDVMLAAPTGRAAKRLSEATEREAKTIHRLLEFGYTGDDELDLFNKNEDNPLEADVIILDEMSMVDVLLMNNLLKALRPGTRLIMVGDSDQLPSVGPGNVLLDIINSSLIRVIRLEEIFRQAKESMIVLNAHLINQGKNPRLNLKGRDFFIDRREEPEDILRTLIELINRRIPSFGGFDPLNDIQILAPMRKGLVGVNNLNLELQKVLNPPHHNKEEKAFGDNIFRLGDKVMQIKNNYKLHWTRHGDKGLIEEGDGVFNGDLGFITSIDEELKEATVLFDEDREITYDFSQMDELELAYATTIHKSQGSEFPVVIIPLAWGPPMLMTRNLLYTAVTRAREMVVIVGRERTIYSMVANNHINYRYSGLESCIQNVITSYENMENYG